MLTERSGWAGTVEATPPGQAKQGSVPLPAFVSIGRAAGLGAGVVACFKATVAGVPHAWCRLGAKCVDIQDCGNDCFSCTDPSGNDVRWSTVYRSPEMRILYAEGSIKVGAMLKPVTGEAVLVVRHVEGTDAKGRTVIRQQTDMIVHADTKTATFVAKVLAPDTPLALDILSDILLEPSFDAEELGREQDVIVQEIGAYKDSPEELVHDYFTEAAFPEQAIGRSAPGADERDDARSDPLRRFARVRCGRVPDHGAEHMRAGATPVVGLDWHEIARGDADLEDGVIRARELRRRQQDQPQRQKPHPDLPDRRPLCAIASLAPSPFQWNRNGAPNETL